jgi:hypothetical protein
MASWFQRFVRGIGHRWGRLESWVGDWRTRRRRLEAGARLIGAEVRQLGAGFWEPIDALHFLPPRLSFTPVSTQYYGHGGFMGAAPALLADRRWRRILGYLMPDVLEQLRAALTNGSSSSDLMTMMVNNPVLAAFGTLHATRLSGDEEHPNHLAGMEWDLFVDSALIEAWEKADTEGRAVCMLKVLDTSLVAHANATDTLQENMGMCQYADVRKTTKTDFGGVEIDSWLDLFARSLVLARAEDLDAAASAMEDEPRIREGEACMLHTFTTPWSVDRVVEVHQEATGRPFLSVILDIKSLRSTPAFLADLVRTLNEHGVHVAAVGSFLREEVEGAGDAPQQVSGEMLPGPREIQFFHFAGDVQWACDQGLIATGQSVLFNGASLLDAVDSRGRHVYSGRLEVVRDLERYRVKHQLEVGFYVQEGDCDADAAAVLSDLVDAWPETFALGFAWGGLRDEASLEPDGERRQGYGKQRFLGMVGRARQWDLGS